MGMAPGAGDLSSQENASDMLREVAWIAGQGEKIRRSDLGECTCGCKQGSGDLIEGGVASHLLMQPGVVSTRAGFAAAPAANQQQIRKLHGPVVHELVPLEQAVNDSL